jgi:hypothetical protein
MSFGRIGSNQEHEFNFIVNITNRISHCTASESSGQTGHGGRMSGTSAMIYVIGSHHRTTELTNQEIFLIGAASGLKAAKESGPYFSFISLNAQLLN